MFAARQHLVAAATVAALFVTASLGHAQTNPLGDGSSLEPTTGRTIIIADSDALRAEFNKAAAAYEQGDFTAGVQTFPRLAEQGYVPAMFAAGVVFKSGQGVTKDWGKALSYFVKGADCNDMKSINNIGVMFRDGGEGLPANPQVAYRFLSRAAMLGDTDAQLSVGALYVNGDGAVRKDLVEGYAWNVIAAQGGEKSAANNLHIIEQHLDASGIAKARARAETLAAGIRAFTDSPTSFDAAAEVKAAGTAQPTQPSRSARQPVQPTQPTGNPLATF